MSQNNDIEEQNKREDVLEHSDDIGKSSEEQMLWEPEDLVWDKSALLEDAATMLQDHLRDVIGMKLIAEQISLDRVVAKKVIKGYVDDGEVNWIVTLRSPQYRTVKTISLCYPIYQGTMHRASYFRDVAGNIIPFSSARVINFVVLGIR